MRFPANLYKFSHSELFYREWQELVHHMISNNSDTIDQMAIFMLSALV